MRSCNSILLVKNVTCVGLRLLFCPVLINNSGEAVLTIPLPSALKLMLREGILLWCLSETLRGKGQLLPHSATRSSKG